MRIRASLTLLAIFTLFPLVNQQSVLAAPQKDTIKLLTALHTVSTKGSAQGSAKIFYQPGKQPHQRFQVMATDLKPHTTYLLFINGILTDNQQSDEFGALEFFYSSNLQTHQRGETALLPAGLKSVLAIKEISIRDSEQSLILQGSFPTTTTKIKPLFSVPSITIEAGQTTTVPISVQDPNGDSLTLTVRCNRGSFVTATGLTIQVAPRDADVGMTSCTATVTDQFSLSSSASFTVTVRAANRAPMIQTVADQTVSCQAPVRVTVQANDPDNDQLSFSLAPGTPGFITLNNNGNGVVSLIISPSCSDRTGTARATLQVRDSRGLTAQTSFNVNVQPAIIINSIAFGIPHRPTILIIAGLGFGSSGAKVMINGQDMSMRIVGQSNVAVTLRGNRRKLGLRTGSNQIQVSAGGVTSNTYSFNLP